MINQASRRHKSRFLVLGLAGLTALLTGCGGGNETEQGNGGGETVIAETGRVVVDPSGWQGFKALATRAVNGDGVDRAEFEALAETPSFAAWRASYKVGPAPSTLRVANWMERTFELELGIETPRKPNSDLRAFTVSYRWSWDQRERVDHRLEALLSSGAAALDRRLDAWIPASRLPDTLRVHVLPGKPELRYMDGHIFVDTGVLAAGTQDQLVRQLSGLAYRNLGAIAGSDPLAEQGAASVAQIFRLLVNEGMGHWLDDLPHTTFEQDHPSLYKVRPVPENYWRYGALSLGRLDEGLAGFIGDPVGLDSGGRELVRSFIAGGGLSQGSWCMATVIAEVLGQERLRSASRSVADFAAAYQEAALRNPTPLPELHEVPDAYHLTMPAFSPEVWAWLEPLLQRTFPAGT